tara:strand:- start:128 stop:367 length:240 start_codon:yes stop_codon:yes gene_type:complete
MAKEKENNQPYVTIDGVDYEESQLDENQKLMVQHHNDLSRKIANATFNLQQLQFGRQAFVDAINASLKNEKPAEEKPSK